MNELAFRDPQLAQQLLGQIKSAATKLTREIRLMEVCGTHTMAIYRNGIRKLLPENIKLVSGPGCPVCVTPITVIDQAIALSRRPNTVLTTFGDLVRVPGTGSTLEKERAKGHSVKPVYSPLDAVKFAEEHPETAVVFAGIGFETTTPAIAASILEAEKRHLKNFHVLASHKVMPPPMRALVADRDIQINGFICPGHVSAIIGSDAYGFLAEEYGIPCVVAGFEPLDILGSILTLLTRHLQGRAVVDNLYRRVVRPEGNPEALRMIEEVFIPSDSEWRGLGNIPGSGLALAPKYQPYDATLLDVEPIISREPLGCRCGEILKGTLSPTECPCFGKGCTPEHPIGACMVSTEGSCSAAYRYGE